MHLRYLFSLIMQFRLEKKILSGIRGIVQKNEKLKLEKIVSVKLR